MNKQTKKPASIKKIERLLRKENYKIKETIDDLDMFCIKANQTKKPYEHSVYIEYELERETAFLCINSQNEISSDDRLFLLELFDCLGNYEPRIKFGLDRENRISLSVTLGFSECEVKNGDMINQLREYIGYMANMLPGIQWEADWQKMDGNILYPHEAAEIIMWDGSYFCYPF